MFKNDQFTVSVKGKFRREAKMDNFVLIGVDDKHKSDISWTHLVCEGDQGMATMIKIMAYMGVVGQQIGDAILAEHDEMTKEEFQAHVQMARGMVKKKMQKVQNAE